ncbi:hypothetical protein Cgig2_002205 [Carnegiea gigantea]|uniref:Uncharacterized protein n=1 Tax=Carnegiea gigantea TaxID=171969 RepID=A0A9Q1K0R5_9CARY|nr:hypothetical protein Cgig2_002205 [Carnegiea gigantea]
MLNISNKTNKENRHSDSTCSLYQTLASTLSPETPRPAATLPVADGRGSQPAPPSSIRWLFEDEYLDSGKTKSRTKVRHAHCGSESDRHFFSILKELEDRGTPAVAILQSVLLGRWVASRFHFWFWIRSVCCPSSIDTGARFKTRGGIQKESLMESYHGLYPTPSRISTMVSAHACQISLQKNYNFGEGLLRVNPELTEEVEEGWLKVVGKNLRNLVNKVEKRPDDKPIIKEGKTPTPSALFARSQSKKDPESGKEKYEALGVEREKPYYEISGGWSKKFTIYDLGASATMFYQKPNASITSTGSTYISSAYSKLQTDLKSTQQQLDEQKKWVDDQRRQFDELSSL